ncbi:helix-turn-helix domain-containing protein [Pseudoduganella umbonata]|uniref:Helix-turn-helix domain-containing protein n=1 Tax=Pseudoduganella umbonata TaxID=864828 RepID=A0ABX5US77_9BURK|nr:helix-turn-helix domain-containing protein [Pseudoduganella umbonata]
MRTIGIFVFPGFSTIDLAVMTVFEIANRQPGGPYYRLELLSDRDGIVASGAGAMVHARAWRESDRTFDTILLLSTHQPMPGDADIVASLRHAGAAARRTGTVCSGMRLMAATGLLDGRRVTTHWSRTGDLQAKFPKLKVQPDQIHVRDGNHWSCSGMTASVDMALAMVEEDLGPGIALTVARVMVVYHWRSGAHTQASTLLDMAPKTSRIQAALTYARQNLRRPLTVDTLAEHAGLSRRHFTRLFRAETGQSPARAIEELRAEAARALLEGGTLSLEAIARETGFNGAEQMRQALFRVFGQTPQALRRRA